MVGDQSSDVVPSCLDPLGRRIVARRDRWEDHLWVRHPEVARHVEAVRLAIEDPDSIRSDADNPDGLNYYRPATLPPPYHRLYLKVCVTFDQQGPNERLGTVITAYPTKRLGRGEVPRWP